MIRRMFRKKVSSVLVKIYKPIEDLWNNEPIDLMTQYALMLKKLGGKLPDVRNIHYHGVFPILDADRQYTPELYAEVMKDSSKAIKGRNGQLALADYRRVIELDMTRSGYLVVLTSGFTNPGWLAEARTG